MISGSCLLVGKRYTVNIYIVRHKWLKRFKLQWSMYYTKQAKHYYTSESTKSEDFFRYLITWKLFHVKTFLSSQCSSVGPHLCFKNENGESVKNNGWSLHKITTQFEETEEFEEIWFQQDGTTRHIGRSNTATLLEMFPGRLISRSGDIPWPPRSPHVWVTDFLFMGLSEESNVHWYSRQIGLEVRIRQ